MVWKQNNRQKTLKKRTLKIPPRSREIKLKQTFAQQENINKDTTKEFESKNARICIVRLASDHTSSALEDQIQLTTDIFIQSSMIVRVDFNLYTLTRRFSMMDLSVSKVYLIANLVRFNPSQVVKESR